MSKTEEVKPVLSANFRMITEIMIREFADNSEDVLEFPASMTREQRNFIDNYAYKFGLKSKVNGKGKPDLHFCKLSKTFANFLPIVRTQRANLCFQERRK